MPDSVTAPAEPAARATAPQRFQCDNRMGFSFDLLIGIRVVNDSWDTAVSVGLTGRW